MKNHLVRKLAKGVLLAIPPFRAFHQSLMDELDQYRVEWSACRDELVRRQAELAGCRAEVVGCQAEAAALRSLYNHPEFVRAMDAIVERRVIITDYACDPESRDLPAAPGWARLLAELQGRDEAYRDVVTDFVKLLGAGNAIPYETTSDTQAHQAAWNNSWTPPVDGMAIYGMLARHNPARFVEVGSGTSTMFARQAIRDHGLRTRIVSIDPYPRADIDVICDEVIRSRFEKVPADFFAALTAEDLLYIDNSHYSFPGSDVTVFFTELLDVLPSGMIYGLHDIFIPYDYPPSWVGRCYNEQYLLAAYLLGGARGDQVVFPAHYVSMQPHLVSGFEPIWPRERGPLHGGSFWMRRA